MSNFQRVFGARKPVIAMVHLGALPGAPLYDEAGGVEAIVEGARLSGARRIAFPHNDVAAAERELAATAAGQVSKLRRDLAPAMTGEDFSFFLREAPGAFVWIGNGPGEGGCELHNPRYDFNDAILPVASGWLAAVARRALDQPPA